MNRSWNPNITNFRELRKSPPPQGRVVGAVLLLVAVLALLATQVAGTALSPIAGDAFLELVSAQDLDVQHYLEHALDEGAGILVTGPMLANYAGDGDTRRILTAVRVVCPDYAALDTVITAMRGLDPVRKVEETIDRPRRNPSGFRGAIVRLNLDGAERLVVVQSMQQTRWLIWMRDVIAGDVADHRSKPFRRYARAVSDYLHAVDTGDADAEVPDPVEYKVPPQAGFDPPRPEYVIQGYETYKRFLRENAGINTGFARGILAFVPTDSLLDAMVAGSPHVAYPNKEAPLLQHEFEKFFARGGDMRALRTLSARILRQLPPGEYFFAVGVSGKVRFGLEMPREEVQRVEAETGRKVPRANHAFLFPGESVLSAGVFFIDDARGRITRVSVKSGHYFYSNVSDTVRRDIAVGSNAYLLTLGHFFGALERMGVDTSGIVISKM